MNSKKPDIYISLDIETDGPCAGINNMLTMGAAAFTEQGVHLATFYSQLKSSYWLEPNPKTMVWWRNQSSRARQEAFGSLSSLTSPQDAMVNFAAWIEKLQIDGRYNRAIAMAWPAAFDFSFINYYCHRFLGYNPLGFACLDIRSYLMGILRRDGYYSMREEDTNKLFGEMDTSDLVEHVARDDAIAQGRLYFHIKNHKLASQSLISKPKDDGES